MSAKVMSLVRQCVASGAADSAVGLAVLFSIDVSAKGNKADIGERPADVCFAPKADIRQHELYRAIGEVITQVGLAELDEFHASGFTANLGILPFKQSPICSAADLAS